MAKKVTLEDLAVSVATGFQDLKSDMNHRFNEVDRKLQEHDQRFDTIERKFDDTISRVDDHGMRIKKLEEVKS